MRGFKTYTICAIGLLSTLAFAFKIIDKEQFAVIVATSGFGSIAAFRSGVAHDQTRTDKRRILRQGLDQDKTKVEP